MSRAKLTVPGTDSGTMPGTTWRSGARVEPRPAFADLAFVNPSLYRFCAAPSRLRHGGGMKREYCGTYSGTYSGTVPGTGTAAAARLALTGGRSLRLCDGWGVDGIAPDA
jgi:hypothetical protein